MTLVSTYNQSMTTSVWLIVIVMTSLVVCSVYGRCSDEYGSNCPSRCSCTTATKINCSRRGLSRVPTDLPSTLTELVLDGNEIVRLYAYDLANCTALLKLNLAINNLTKIEKSAFVDTALLTSLDLSFNRIVVSELANDTFDTLRRLKILRIDNNRWFNGSYYHWRLVSNLIRLRDLYMDGLPNRTFPEQFSRLENLKNLTITGGLNWITNETFAAFNESKIGSLTIRAGNYLTAVEPLSFAHFRHLDSLSLSKNRNISFENVADAWYGLEQTNITFLGLSMITTGNDKLQIITKKFFRYLDRTKISILILANNDLVHIEPCFSENLKHLDRLGLAGNRLYNPTALIADLAKLPKLTDVQASFQYCPSDPLDSVKFTTTLEYKSIDKFVKLHRSNYELDVSKCRTYKVQECNTAVRTTAAPSGQLSVGNSASPVCIPLPHNLRNLRVNDGLFVYLQTLPPVTITEGGGQLNKIELGSNSLRNINGPIIFKNPPQNLTIALDFNQIECLHPNVFKIAYENDTKITQLYLNVNNLGLQLERDTDGLTFQYYPFLQVLKLNYNGIKQLHSGSFRNQTKLQKLTLFGNALKDIDFEFTHMRELKLLDLSYNDLTYLRDSMMKKLEAFIEGNKNFSLALRGNPLQCTCDTLPFLRWMNRYRDNMDNFEANSCFFSGEYRVFSTQFEHILAELEFECNKSIAVIMSGILVGLVLILATVSAVCYRNRWEIRYAFIKLTQRGQRYQQLFAKTVQYDYDAFVVYDSADRQWVYDELLPHLEQNAASSGIQYGQSSNSNRSHQGLYTGLRFCVHERDFNPGEDIIGNIWNKMERSRKVILVISETFATSHYCDYELNLARMQSVEVGRNIIVPILLGMPDIDRITDCLFWVLRKVTYLEWPQSEEDRSRFWHKLRHTIAGDDVDTD